ncbi:peptide deformylase [Anaerotalea alkaliphila]|uniref:Peptide deformylase n=1 Tax=Anaerotalea alkaliphila TaxID=2662126 RepID=A0A7X5HUI2_9FIRM|nr:peptide deformylase [Anaerotalea alkaliphila]NDL66892.1 peptide deformylase [Anaerotalea alkaliphila]
MALRKIRIEGDPILRKRAKEVDAVSDKVKDLAQDMLDTMYHAQGVGLAAPQVGILKRVVVVDIGDGPMVLVNPVIVRQDGEQVGPEGCLSVPGKAGTVVRPNHVVVESLDLTGTRTQVEGEGFLARALCHELDHLEGKLYVDIATDMITDEDEELA